MVSVSIQIGYDEIKLLLCSAMPVKKSTRGGRRPGAGRKPILRDPVTLSVKIEGSMSDALVELAEASGVGFSEYIRKVLASHVGGRSIDPTP